MTKSASDRVAVVTGGSGGIGRATCMRLARDVWGVVVHYVGSRDSAEDIVKDISGQGVSAIAVQADLADGEQVKALFEQPRSPTVGSTSS